MCVGVGRRLEGCQISEEFGVPLGLIVSAAISVFVGDVVSTVLYVATLSSPNDIVRDNPWGDVTLTDAKREAISSIPLVVGSRHTT